MARSAPASVKYYTRNSTTSLRQRQASNYVGTTTGSFHQRTNLGYVPVQILEDNHVEFDENRLGADNATGGAMQPGGTPTSTAVALLTIMTTISAWPAELHAGRLHDE